MDEYGAWESRRIIEDFNAFCVTLYRNFGDKVRYWVSLNEQNYDFHHGFITSLHPPGVKDRKRFYEANHIAFLANARAIESFRQHVPNGKIGPSFAYSPAYPLTSSPADILACENAEAFTNDWWLDVYCRGTYPEVPFRYLCERGLAPTIEDGDLELLQRGIPDFLGVNYYKTLTYEANPLDGVSDGAMNTTGQKGTGQETGIPGLYKTKRNPQLPTSNWDWAIDPVGLRIGLRRLASRYRAADPDHGKRSRRVRCARVERHRERRVQDRLPPLAPGAMPARAHRWRRSARLLRVVVHGFVELAQRLPEAVWIGVRQS